MLQGVLSNDERHAQMFKALGFPMLKKKNKFNDKWISIVCYGPSLEKTWKQIKYPVVTVSGAHDFMVNKGIVPSYHVDCDPREHKAKMLKKPHRDISYLMASVCHPEFWNVLKGKQVRLWHLINGDDMDTVEWVAKNHHEGIDSMIGGGSSVGMRAMNVLSALGYRRFRFYGFDCSFVDKQYAGEHLGKQQAKTFVRAGDRVFVTTRQLLQTAIEMEKFIETQDAEIVFHGDGLMQETAKILKQRKQNATGRKLDKREFYGRQPRQNGGFLSHGTKAK